MDRLLDTVNQLEMRKRELESNADALRRQLESRSMSTNTAPSRFIQENRDLSQIYRELNDVSYNLNKAKQELEYLRNLNYQQHIRDETRRLYNIGREKAVDKSHNPYDGQYEKGKKVVEELEVIGEGNRIKSMLKYMDKYIVEKLKIMGLGASQAKRKAKSKKAEQLKNELVLKMMKLNGPSMKGGMKARKAKKASKPKKKVSAKQKKRYAMIRKIMANEGCTLPQAQAIIKKYNLMD